jgi:cytochrome c oxidase subunit 3/cytochrome o ubiquinol oxidase subunit 3
MSAHIKSDADGLTLSPDDLVMLSPVKVGMLTFLASEAAFFGTLIMTYVFFLRQTSGGVPNPSQVFRLPLVLVASACLFSSSATIYAAEKSLRKKARQAFLGWWGLTILLGVTFLAGTMIEWNDVIGRFGLTISRNLFGTTYFTLVGFHALHVTVGVALMCIVFGLAWRRQITERNESVVEAVSWYWHFVDGVWVLVFLLVYVVGR